jgi:MoxR-like ATPase
VNDAKDTTSAGQTAARIVEAVSSVIRGKEAQTKLAVTALLAGGHLLVEDAPGVGKTTLARALAKVVGLPFRRVQFTSDLMPADVLGGNVFDPAAASFHFRPGPIFTSFLLADEINRTTPKTQSALLEAMEERQVSLDGETRALSPEFFVIATQNPLDFEGTYPLPESQLDRFMLRVALGPPPVSVERALLERRGAEDPVEALTTQLDTGELTRAKAAVDGVRVEAPVLDYLHSIVLATRESKALAAGASTRAALVFVRAVRARALVEGRAHALPDDVKALALPVLSHRLRLHGAYGPSDREETTRALRAILEALPVPR